MENKIRNPQNKKSVAQITILGHLCLPTPLLHDKNLEIIVLEPVELTDWKQPKQFSAPGVSKRSVQSTLVRFGRTKHNGVDVKFIFNPIVIW